MPVSSLAHLENLLCPLSLFFAFLADPYKKCLLLPLLALDCPKQCIFHFVKGKIKQKCIHSPKNEINVVLLLSNTPPTPAAPH